MTDSHHETFPTGRRRPLLEQQIQMGFAMRVSVQLGVSPDLSTLHKECPDLFPDGATREDTDKTVINFFRLNQLATLPPSTELVQPPIDPNL